MNAEELIIKGLISELPEQDQAIIADAMEELCMWARKYPEYATICLVLVVARLIQE